MQMYESDFKQLNAYSFTYLTYCIWNMVVYEIGEHIWVVIDGVTAQLSSGTRPFTKVRYFIFYYYCYDDRIW